MKEYKSNINFYKYNDRFEDIIDKTIHTDTQPWLGLQPFSFVPIFGHTDHPDHSILQFECMHNGLVDMFVASLLIVFSL